MGIDNAYNKLVNDADKAAGGITLGRYKELYAQFIGAKDEGPYMYLFGPLKEIFLQNISSVSSGCGVGRQSVHAVSSSAQGGLQLPLFVLDHRLHSSGTVG